MQNNKAGGRAAKEESEKDRNLREQLTLMMRKMVETNRNAAALSHVHDAAETAALGASFLLTGERGPRAVLGLGLGGFGGDV